VGQDMKIIYAKAATRKLVLLGNEKLEERKEL